MASKKKVKVLPVGKVNPMLVKAIQDQYPDEKITHIEFVTTCKDEGQTTTSIQQMFAICE